MNATDHQYHQTGYLCYYQDCVWFRIVEDEKADVKQEGVEGYEKVVFVLTVLFESNEDVQEEEDCNDD